MLVLVGLVTPVQAAGLILALVGVPIPALVGVPTLAQAVGLIPALEGVPIPVQAVGLIPALEGVPMLALVGLATQARAATILTRGTAPLLIAVDNRSSRLPLTSR